MHGIGEIKQFNTDAQNARIYQAALAVVNSLLAEAIADEDWDAVRDAAKVTREALED